MIPKEVLPRKPALQPAQWKGDGLVGAIVENNDCVGFEREDVVDLLLVEPLE